jgi:predicted negative regulator of RcsB-dependent stress response
MALESKKYDRALEYLRVADQSFTGFWLIQEHIAETLAKLGREDEAIAIYKKVVAQTNNPEYMMALSKLLKARAPQEAADLQASGIKKFQERFKLLPEASIGHFLESLINIGDSSSLLLELAQKNYDIRPNAQARLKLAKAYISVGKLAQAKNQICHVEKTPWRTPEFRDLKTQLKARCI